MAAVIGNVALLLDVNSHRTVITDRRIRQAVVDVVLNLPKRDSHSHVSSYYAALSSNKPLESDGEARIRRFLTRGKANSRTNAVDFDDAGSSDEESGDDGKEPDEEDEAKDVDKDMKRRVKELQDMKELERKAEELQYRIEEDGDDSEEKKRMRVKRELEKVRTFRA